MAQNEILFNKEQRELWETRAFLVIPQIGIFKRAND